MRTTVEIPDALLRRAKAYAVRHGIPLRYVFEAGLRTVLEAPPPGKPFRLKMITTKGRLVCDDNWETIRSLIYEGPGG